MILTLDIGNTNIKTALFDGQNMVKYWRLSTSITNTSDEYGITIMSLFRHEGIDPKAVEGIVMSSVVPTVNFTIEHMCLNYFGIAPMVIGPGVRTGINIRYENPRELGSDRIANAVAAYDEYGGDKPVIFIDFGTATTFGVVDRDEKSGAGAFLGGAIFPGIKLASEALTSGTAKTVTANTVVLALGTRNQAPLAAEFEAAGLVTNLVQKMKSELGRDALVVATGGMAVLIAEESKVIDKLDGLLTLKGLRLIYERNKG